MTAPEYLRRTRRMLLDMHIPDWDERFLRDYDPEQLASCYEAAGVNAVMMYCKSHLGLPYWPTTTGRQHPALNGRDVVGELLTALHARGLAACAYTSVTIDREAAVSHPDWELVPARVVDGERTLSLWRRHHALCFNKRGYLDLERAQLADLLGRYPFDACFLDMMFWPGICVCDDCRHRFADEASSELPDRIDWRSETWVRFVAARERWLDEFAQTLIAHARECADIPVYQNFSPSVIGWEVGKPLHTFRNDTFFGGDFHQGADNELFACKLMLAISPGQPPEFMSPRSMRLMDHATVTSEREMTLQMLGATVLSCAMLFIDAIDPGGAVNLAAYEQIGRIFERRKPYEPYLGGDHVEDVGVYFSSDAIVRLADDGTPLSELGPMRPTSPHLSAAVGASRVLRQMHVPAGVVTERQLDHLDRYAVLVVPDLTRIGEREAQAFDAYVRRGGRLYASGRTGLLRTDAEPVEDFVLADLFGVSYDGDERGLDMFVRPVGDAAAAAIAPQQHVTWTVTADATVPPRLAPEHAGEVLAALSLPYGYPELGSARDQQWASMYSSPPWEDTDRPLVVRRSVEAGAVVYSALPLETGGPAARRLLMTLLSDLLAGGAAVTADAPDTVGVETFHQPDRGRYVVSLLDYASEGPPAELPVAVRLQLPAGTTLGSVERVPDDAAQLDHTVSDAGVVEVTTTFRTSALLVIEYVREEQG